MTRIKLPAFCTLLPSDMKGRKAMLNEEFRLFSFCCVPQKIKEDYLLVSDAMGNTFSKFFCVERNTFYNNIIILVTDGILYLEQYNKKCTLTKGMGVIMKLTDYHKYYSDRNSVADIWWIHFRGKAVEGFLDTLFNNQNLPYVFPVDDELEKICLCYEIAKDANENYEYDLSAQLYELILGIVKHPMSNLTNVNNLKYLGFISDIQRFIEDNIYENITLTDLCGSAKMSKFYFTRVFTECFKISPMQFVLCRKIDLSKKLLTQTNEKIQSIAHSLWFADQSHFSKTFKKQVGTSPLQYRQMYR